MRILTVRQPWAWAIVHLGKDVENRGRNIAGTYRGPVAIHAGRAWDKNWRYLDSGPQLFFAVAAAGYPDVDFGAIIGVVDLVDVHASCDTVGWDVCSQWAESDQWHMVLANPRPLAQPIPYTGALGLRELPDDVAALVLGQVT